ncbi:MAG: TIGR02996 domain-containing protein [Deltaproteobacteria bacterium]
MARNLELEDQIGQSGDAATYLVYADWLIEREDPRGELIALEVALEQDPRNVPLAAARDALLERHSLEWLGELAGRPGVRWTWKRGFVDAATIVTTTGTTHAAMYEAIRGLPTASLLRELTFGFIDSDQPEIEERRTRSWQSATDALARHGMARSLRRLVYDDGRERAAELGTLAGLYPQATSLESFEITTKTWARRCALGSMDLGAIVLPALRELKVRSSAFRLENLESLTAALWPRLERLTLRFSGLDCEPRDLISLIDALPPTLRHLSINPGYGVSDPVLFHELVLALARSRLVRQLATLDLSYSCFSDDDAAIILENPDPFRHLEVLDLSETNLNLGTVRRLRAEVDRVVARWGGVIERP